MSENIYSSHSAEVQMWLDCGIYGRLPLSRITPNSVVLQTPIDVPACEANLVVSVDGELIVRRVQLAAGLSKDQPAALVLPIDHFAPF